jgi:hypothetical protein
MKPAPDSHMVSGVSHVSMTSEIYFTAIEDHFRSARGTGLFLLSPTDFKLAKAWQDGGVPLEAVLRGIDRAFENRRKYASRSGETVNSLAYCTQTVLAEAQILVNASRMTPPESNPFTIDDLRAFIARNRAALLAAGHAKFAAALETLDLEELYFDLEELERRLTTIEENVITGLRSNFSEPMLIKARCSLEIELKPYREKMTMDQLAQLEERLFERILMESAGLPRLSLFYL